MSYAVSDWAWEQECRTSAMQFVLLCLAFYANKSGTDAYPSIATICRRTRLDERTVRKALTDLIAAGLITRHDRKADNGRCLSTEYRLIVREPTPANMQEAPSDQTPANMQETPWKSPWGDPDKFVPTTPTNLQGNPVPEPSKVRSLRERVEAVDCVNVSISAVDELWQQGLPIMRRLIGGSDRSCRALIGRFRKHAFDDCARVLDALRRAEDVRPAVPVEFIMAALRPDAGLSQHERIRREGNFPTHFGHWDDDDEPAQQQRRAIA